MIVIEWLLLLIAIVGIASLFLFMVIGFYEIVTLAISMFKQ